MAYLSHDDGRKINRRVTDREERRTKRSGEMRGKDKGGGILIDLSVLRQTAEGPSLGERLRQNF